MVGSRCVAHWRARLTSRTWAVCKYVFRDFMAWLGENGGVFSDLISKKLFIIVTISFF